MLCPGVVAKLEGLVSSAPTSPLRIFAGIACLSTHGIKRLSDIQHFEKWSSSEDSTVVVSWKSTRKLASLRCAALRVCLSGQDWASTFEHEMSMCGLPGVDFFMPLPTTNFNGFTRSHATWSDCAGALYAVLLLTGMEAESVMLYTPHSMRHTYPTMARQLLLRDDVISLMGHWALKNKMPGTYDSAHTSSELQYKKFVVDNYIAGWRPVSDENIAQNRRVPLDAPDEYVYPVPAPLSPQASLLGIENEFCTAVAPGPPEIACPARDPNEDRLERPELRSDGKPFFKGAQREVEVAVSYRFSSSTCQILNGRVGAVHLL